MPTEIREPVPGNVGTPTTATAVGTEAEPVPTTDTAEGTSQGIYEGTPTQGTQGTMNPFTGTPEGTRPGTSGTEGTRNTATAGTGRGNAGNKRPTSVPSNREPRNQGTGNEGNQVPQGTGNDGTGSPKVGRELPKGKMAIIWVIVFIGLTLVIAAPTVLSSQDLYDWAKDPHGLGLDGIFPYFVPAALDLAAVVCIGMTLIATMRAERAQVFALLVWVFAGTSGYAQYSHGIVARDSGGAQDAWWAMPSFALLGPLLLEVTLHTIRRWTLSDEGQTVSALRWLPGVAFRSSFRAWKVGIRENLKPTQAWRFSRDVQLLKGMPPVDAVIYAGTAAETMNPYEVRQWLAARGTFVTQKDLEEAAGNRLRPVLAVPTGAVPIREVPTYAPDGFPFPTDPSFPVPVSPAPAGSRELPGGVPSGSLGNAGSRERGNEGSRERGNEGTRERGNGQPLKLRRPVPSPEVPGSPGTRELGNLGTGNGEHVRGPFAEDGTDLAPLYSRHRTRLELVKANISDWQTAVDEPSVDSLKAAGGFSKPVYATEIRKLLRHERAQLANAI